MSQLNCHAVANDGALITEPDTKREAQIALGFAGGTTSAAIVPTDGRIGSQSSTSELGKRLDMAVRFDTTSAFRADPFGRILALSDPGISIPSATAIEFKVPGGALLSGAPLPPHRHIEAEN